MRILNFDVEAIERIMNHATEAMQDSKYQIFEICEAARQEKDSLSKELQQVMVQLRETIASVDELGEKYRRSRVRLVEVSRDFHRYGEKEIRTAYEQASEIQLGLTIAREKEETLKCRRDDLQRRLRNIERTVERAEALFSQMNVVLEYLSGDFSQVTRILESAKTRQLLGLKIILAQEEERKRIAREMHDGPAQSMANLILRTEIAERMLARGETDVVREELAGLKSQVRVELEEVRNIIYNLRPMALDDLGLTPTIRKLTQDFEEKQRVRTRFEVKGRERRLTSGMEVALFRMVQEALTNIVKHAQATHVQVELSFGASSVKMVVQDNGVGFDTRKMEERGSREEHFGLVGMQERVELLEGSCTIESDRQKGTRVTIEVPFENTVKEEVNHG